MLTQHAPGAPWPPFVFIPQPRIPESDQFKKEKKDHPIVTYIKTNGGATKDELVTATRRSASSVSAKIDRLGKALRSEVCGLHEGNGKPIYRYYLNEVMQ